MYKLNVAVSLLLVGFVFPLAWAQASSPELPAGPMLAKATNACTECHEARIIVQQRLSKAAWTKEVDKMTKWGALVDAADRDALVDYLSQHFTRDLPPYKAPRTAEEKTTAKRKSAK